MQRPAKAWGALGVLAVGTVGAACAQADKPPVREVLVELFTSEGCSSCPPADALLARLDGTTTDAGVLVVGLSEHVTYWNNLGWVDPFSQEAFTRRQSAYGDRFKLESVYTPQMVVNGMAQAVGSDRETIARAIARTAAPGSGARTARLRIASAKAADGKIAVSYEMDGEAAENAAVWAVVAEDRETSKVDRGENGGRTLTHVAVARSLTRVGAAKAGISSIELPEPEAVPGRARMGRHVVVFVQEAGAARVLAVGSLAIR